MAGQAGHCQKPHCYDPSAFDQDSSPAPLTGPIPAGQTYHPSVPLSQIGVQPDLSISSQAEVVDLQFKKASCFRTGREQPTSGSLIDTGRTMIMRATAAILLSSLIAAALSGCVQSDEEYFKQVERSGVSQQQRNLQSLRSSYGSETFQREKQEAGQER